MNRSGRIGTILPLKAGLNIATPPGPDIRHTGAPLAPAGLTGPEGNRAATRRTPS